MTHAYEGAALLSCHTVKAATKAFTLLKCSFIEYAPRVSEMRAGADILASKTCHTPVATPVYNNWRTGWLSLTYVHCTKFFQSAQWGVIQQWAHEDVCHFSMPGYKVVLGVQTCGAYTSLIFVKSLLY